MREISYNIDPLDVRWTMDWRSKDGTKDPKFADKPDTEDMYEESGMLAVLIANGWVFLNNHWWKKDWPAEARKQFCVFLHMNDTFAYACADAEEFTFDELKDVYLHFERDPEWGPVVWTAKKRRIMPIEPVVERMAASGVDVDALSREIEELKNGGD